MFNIFNTERTENESELQYIWRLCSAKDSGLLDYTWDELANVLNKNLREEDEEWTSSAYRKKYQQAKVFYDEVFSKMESEHYYQELLEQKRDLERMKIQFRDERNAWNKQNYIDARATQKLDYLEEQLISIGKTQFSNNNVKPIKSNNDLLVILSDLHIGQTFHTVFGEYNTNIAKKRLDQYLKEIINIKDIYNSENVYVSIQGDLLSGNIHKSIQVTNRENVIEQIKIATELIASFCHELSKNFNNVYVTNVAGNHSRLDKKDEALHDERYDDLIGWAISMLLHEVSNVYINSVDKGCFNIDNGIAQMNIRGKKYINVHGDYDGFSKNGVANLSMMLGFIPDVITFGHLHACAMSEENGVKLIRGGSLAGSGDFYTVEKRLSGKPSQMVCICTSDGIKACCPIELD